MNTPRSTLLAAASIWLAIFSFPSTAISARPPTPEAAALELEKGNLQEGLRLLKTSRKRHPADPLGYVIAARALLRDGEAEQAKKLLENGLSRVQEKGDLHYMLGIQLLTEARDGPGVTRTANGVSFQPTKGIDKDTFRLQRLQDAQTHLHAARGTEAFEIDATPPLIYALVELGRHEEAIAVAREALDDEHPDPQTLCGAMQALNELKRSSEALELARQHLPYFERSSPVWYLLSQTHELMGNADQASDCMARAKFFNRLPGFINVAYSPEAAADLQRLFGDTDNATESNSVFGPKMDLEAVEQSIERLAISTDPNAPQLLAALCYSHIAHGRLEDRAFETLADSGQEDLLMAILANSQNGCTIGGALRALSRMKSDKSFDLLVKHLSNDEGLFSMGIPQSMVLLGDERAVPHLASRLDAATRPIKKRKGPVDPMALLHSMVDTGGLVRALSDFGTPEALAAIQRHLQSDGLAFVTHAALYRHTAEPQHLDQLHALLNADKADNAYNALAILKQLPDTPQNQALLERLTTHLNKDRRYSDSTILLPQDRAQKNDTRAVHDEKPKYSN